MADLFSLLLQLWDRWRDKRRLSCTIYKMAIPSCVIYQERWNTTSSHVVPLKSYDQLIKISLNNSSDKPISYFEFQIFDESSKQPIDFLTQAKIDNQLVTLITSPVTTIPFLPNTYSTLQGHSRFEMLTAIKANVGTKIRVSFRVENRMRPISRVVEITQEPQYILNPKINLYAHDIINTFSYNGAITDGNSPKSSAARTGRQSSSQQEQNRLTEQGKKLVNDEKSLKNL